MELQSFFNVFLKIKGKEAQINLIIKINIQKFIYVNLLLKAVIAKNC